MTLVVILLAILFSSCWIETTADNQPPRLSIQWFEFSCIGGDRALSSTGLWLSYTSNSTDETGADDQTYSCRVWVNYNSSLPKLQYYEGNVSRNITSVSFIFEQPEHGGGSCHCFNISESSLIKRLVVGGPETKHNCYARKMEADA